MIKVTKLDDCFVVSEDGTWVEGTFETEKAAQIAPMITPCALSELWYSKKDSDGVIRQNITEEELYELYEKFAKRQDPLGTDFSAAIFESVEDLYEE